MIIIPNRKPSDLVAALRAALIIAHDLDDVDAAWTVLKLIQAREGAEVIDLASYRRIER